MANNKTPSKKEAQFFIFSFIILFVVLLFLTPVLFSFSVLFYSLWISFNLLSLSLLGLLYIFGIIKQNEKLLFFGYGCLLTGFWAVFYTGIMLHYYDLIAYITGIPLAIFFLVASYIFFRKQKQAV